MKHKSDLYSRTNQLVIDGSVFAISFATAYLIRFEGVPDWSASKQLFLWLPYLIAVRLLVNWKFGIYRFIWRYVSLPDAVAIGRSLSVVTALLLALRLFYPDWAPFAQRARLPLSVIALEFLLSLVGSLSVRALRRLLYERGERSTILNAENPKRVILYGAGRAGLLLAKELKNQGEVELVGFVDDDFKKVGTVISGRKVLGRGEELRKIVREFGADEVMISIATASPKALREVLERCQEIPIPAKIIPSLHEVVSGRVSITQVRDVQVEDLLGRDTVEIQQPDEAVREAYMGKRILVSGAGGSIGSELVRQLLPLAPASVGILDKDENSTYELEQELLFRFPSAPIEPHIADIRHPVRLQAVFARLRPHVVFHAAAHKHVPLMQKQPCEAVLNNVGGTKILLETCREHRVERFVFISTDKAVNPTSVMGATKRVGELLVESFANAGSLPSACVRFGNVMGSRGSVIPLFQRQIREGGPITVTHPDVVRFFMTIPEAVQLVLCAGTLGRCGEVFVLDMGDPRKILEVAQEMALLSGLVPGRDIKIALTGLRGGEKIAEELIDGKNEALSPTRFDKVRLVVGRGFDAAAFARKVDILIDAARRESPDEVYEILRALDIGFNGEVKR